MAQKIFQVLDDSPTIYWGKNIYTAAGQTAVEPGLLVQRTSGSTVSLNTTTTIPLGFAYGLRYAAYHPTTVIFDAGEAITIVQGRGLALVSSDFFTGGTLPASGDTLVTGLTGLMDPTSGYGSYKVGKCLRIEPYSQFTGGTGTAQTVALIQFEFSPFGTGS